MKYITYLTAWLDWFFLSDLSDLCQSAHVACFSESVITHLDFFFFLKSVWVLGAATPKGSVPNMMASVGSRRFLPAGGTKHQGSEALLSLGHGKA